MLQRVKNYTCQILETVDFFADVMLSDLQVVHITVRGSLMAFYLGMMSATALDREAFEAGPHRVCCQGIVYREEMQHLPSRATYAVVEESEGSRCGRPLQALGTVEGRAGRACVRSCSGQMHGSASPLDSISARKTGNGAIWERT